MLSWGTASSHLVKPDNGPVDVAVMTPMSEQRSPCSQTLQRITKFYMKMIRNVPLLMSKPNLISWSSRWLQLSPITNIYFSIYTLLCLFSHTFHNLQPALTTRKHSPATPRHPLIAHFHRNKQTSNSSDKIYFSICSTKKHFFAPLSNFYFKMPEWTCNGAHTHAVDLPPSSWSTLNNPMQQR